MKPHTITLTNIQTEEKLEYTLQISEEDAFDVMELLCELHEIIHHEQWNALASLSTI